MTNPTNPVNDPVSDPRRAGGPPGGGPPGGGPPGGGPPGGDPGHGVPGSDVTPDRLLALQWWEELAAEHDEGVVARVDALLGPDVDDGVRLAALWDALAPAYECVPHERWTDEERRLVDLSAPEGGWRCHDPGHGPREGGPRGCCGSA